MQKFKVVFKNELDTSVFDDYFYSLLFQRIVKLSAKKRGWDCGVYLSWYKWNLNLQPSCVLVLKQVISLSPVECKQNCLAVKGKMHWLCSTLDYKRKIIAKAKNNKPIPFNSFVSKDKTK